jgi:hypothetical protein
MTDSIVKIFVSVVATLVAIIAMSFEARAADFATRCQDPNVLRCIGFDSAAVLTGTYGNISGTLTGASVPEIDLVQKASGGGSLKFTIPSNSAADTSGSWFTNFSDDLSVQFGENSVFFVQWRQRFSPEFLTTLYQDGGGWKQSIITTGDQPDELFPSCTALTVVTQNINHRGFVQMYNSCIATSSHGPYDPFEERVTINGVPDFKLQNARAAPYCLYTQGLTTPPSFFPPAGNCYAYFPNEWMTFQVSVQTGPRVNDSFTNSFVKMWVARPGKPAELVINWGPYNLTAGQPADDEKFGKIWLLPYNTGKSAAQTHATAYTWYDELIISRSRIEHPDGPSGEPVPAAPSGFKAQ